MDEMSIKIQGKCSVDTKNQKNFTLIKVTPQEGLGNGVKKFFSRLKQVMTPKAKFTAKTLDRKNKFTQSEGTMNKYLRQLNKFGLLGRKKKGGRYVYMFA